jgi:hypothetical protein
MTRAEEVMVCLFRWFVFLRVLIPQSVDSVRSIAWCRSIQTLVAPSRRSTSVCVVCRVSMRLRFDEDRMDRQAVEGQLESSLSVGEDGVVEIVPEFEIGSP